MYVKKFAKQKVFGLVWNARKDFLGLLLTKPKYTGLVVFFADTCSSDNWKWILCIDLRGVLGLCHGVPFQRDDVWGMQRLFPKNGEEQTQLHLLLR